MRDAAGEQPALVAAMSAALEDALGAPLEAIEAAEMGRNLADYFLMWHTRCTGASLVDRFMASFRNGWDRAAVVARVAAWAGVSPLEANGTAVC